MGPDSAGTLRRIFSNPSCIRRSPTPHSSRAPHSSIDSTRRTRRSRLLPHHPATARRRCWPNGRGVTLRASRGFRSTGMTTTSDGWCRTPRLPSVGSIPADPKRCHLPTAVTRWPPSRPIRGRDLRNAPARPSRLRPCRGAPKRRLPRHDRRTCTPPPDRLAARPRDARNHHFPWRDFAPALTS